MADRPPRPRTISIGGATFDLFVRANTKELHEDVEHRTLNLPIGAKIRVDDVIETCGGGASNSSVGLARLGCDAAFCGVVGSDQWGEKLLANMRKEGVDTSLATVVEGETSSSSIILSVGSGERTILYDPGTNAHLHGVTFDVEEASKRDWIYLNHLQEDSLLIQDNLLTILKATEKPLGLTWNPGGFQVEAGLQSDYNSNLLAHTHLLLLNKEEALAFARVKSLEEALATFLKAGVRIACVTDGSNGTTATDGAKTYHCPVITDAPVIDTTGAGDAFGIGMTWAILAGLDLPTALRAGTINATSVLGTLGAQAGLLTDIEMRKRLQSVQLDVQAIA